jgi:energy-coupling factor transporter ATP-binding protein EcfA2
VNRVRAPLKEAELFNRLDDSPLSFSTGQMKFAALVIACAAAPPLLLLDEPTAALDNDRTAGAIAAIKNAAAAGSAVVVATHDHRLTTCEEIVTKLLRLE